MIDATIRAKLYVDHVVLTVKESDISKLFYSTIFGDPDYSDRYQLMYYIGNTKLFLCSPHITPSLGDKFNPNRIGLEHLAFGVQTVKQLQQIETTLNENFIKNSGIHIDKHSSKEKIWLDDPDGIRLEFYIRP